MNRLTNIFSFCLLMIAFTQCTQEDKPLYQSKEFSLYADKVVQGNFVGKAISATELQSNYQSPASQFKPAEIVFKFAINGRDNEMMPGVDHTFYVDKGTKETPVISFGKHLYQPAPEGKYLDPNTKIKIRLDFTAPLKQMSEQGFFTAWNGDKIYKQDFQGVFIAGGTSPLTWDFDNLGRKKDMQLQDADGDGIYEIELVFNQHDESKAVALTWKPQHDLSKFPKYESPHILADAIYNLSLDEMVTAIEPDNTFRTGKEWAGVWTRDISYSIILSMAMMQPEVAKISLMRKVKNDRIIQDTGTGGAWPVSTDRMIWAVAAWEIYKVTGEKEWLQYSFRVVKNSLDDDHQVAFDNETGLVKGESSFLDWREQTYPRWMQPADIFESICLGTNAVHFQANQVCAFMAKALGQPEQASKYEQMAATIKQGINTHLWLEDKGYYGQYLYGRTHKLLSPKAEALGEALCVLFGIAEGERAKRVVQNTPVTPFGIPCIYPQIPGIPPYHNNGIWPFVQSYWALAAHAVQHEQSFIESQAAIYRAAALFLTNKENMVAENGDFAGTQVNSSIMLWSLSGNLALVYKGLFGMQFKENGLYLKPFVPKSLEGVRTLSGLKYRNGILDIRLEGFGDQISEIRFDGVPMSDALIPAGLEGNHSVEIKLNGKLQTYSTNKVANATAPEMPKVRFENELLVWEAVTGAKTYVVYKYGKEIARTTDTSFKPDAVGFSSWQVLAVDQAGNSSFASEPIETGASKSVADLASSTAPGWDVKGYWGKGFVEISQTHNRLIPLTIKVLEDGWYALRLRYANGNGPVNTENKCALRTLSINKNLVGTFVFPQRGANEWSNWGYSNTMKLYLNKGEHMLKLIFEPANQNMHGETNQALLNQLEFFKIGEKPGA